MPQRFLVHFMKAPDGIEAAVKQNVHVYSYDDHIYINTNGLDAKAYLYNAIGQELKLC